MSVCSAKVDLIKHIQHQVTTEANLFLPAWNETMASRAEPLGCRSVENEKKPRNDPLPMPNPMLSQPKSRAREPVQFSANFEKCQRAGLVLVGIWTECPVYPCLKSRRKETFARTILPRLRLYAWLRLC